MAIVWFTSQKTNLSLSIIEVPVAGPECVLGVSILSRFPIVF